MLGTALLLAANQQTPRTSHDNLNAVSPDIHHND
jgi:hypothetical protein